MQRWKKLGKRAGVAMALGLAAVLVGALIGWSAYNLVGEPPPAQAVVQPGPPAPAAPPPGRLRQASLAGRPWASAAAGPPRLAVVIDDIGYDLAPVQDLLGLAVPLTFSVLPELPHSREAAGLISAAGQQYILHLPMQPVDFPRENPGPDALLLDLSPGETQRRLERYLHELPEAVGASNHMGSAYTADDSHMQQVQADLAAHHLFFLNSKTSNTPVPAAIARQGGYPYLERDVFLDNARDERRIAAQVREALRYAQRHGQAVAIGHPYPETLQVLRRELTGPLLQDVELVPLSRLVRR